MSDAPVQPITLARVGRLALVAVLLGAVLFGLGVLATHTSNSPPYTDSAISRWFVMQRVDSLNHVTLIASNMARTSTVMAVATVAFFAMRLLLHRWHESLVLAIALAGEVLIFLTVAFLVHRPRPPVFRLDPAPPTSSFPSGHTAAAVTVYGFLAVVIWRYVTNRYIATIACVLLLAMPVAVGLSRLYRGAHYLTDVLGGALLGAIWVTVVMRTLMPKRSSEIAALETRVAT